MGVVADREFGLDTLLIPLDGKQNDLATHFGIEGDTDDGVLADLAVPTGEGPDLIPASVELDGVDKSLSDIDDPTQRYSFLDDFLSQYVDDQYDLVLIDVPLAYLLPRDSLIWTVTRPAIVGLPLILKRASLVSSQGIHSAKNTSKSRYSGL